MVVPSETKNTSDAILDAADRMIARHGLRKTTMEDVAQEAGVSRRTVYGYFSNKQELALASIDRVVQQAQAKIAEEAETAEPAAERLYRMLIARVEVRIELVRDISSSLDSIFSVVRKAYMQKRRQYFKEEASMLAAVIDEGKKEGAFGSIDSMETAMLFVEATNAYLPYSLSLEELEQSGDVRRRIQKTAAILVAGIIR